MLKQAKKQYRSNGLNCYRGKMGFHAELSCCYDEETAWLIRGRRGKWSLQDAWLFSYERKSICRVFKKSWKDRCRKQHQWEKHFQTDWERTYLAYNCRQYKKSDRLLTFLRTFPDWVKIDIRDNEEWKRGIDQLIEQKKIECREESFNLCYLSDYPIRTVRFIHAVPSPDEDEYNDLLRLHQGWQNPDKKRTRHNSRCQQKNLAERVEQPQATPLPGFYSTLPHSIRRNWRYRQWEEVMKFTDAKVKKNYLALLNAALRLKLKIMCTPHDPKNNPYARLLWNLSKTTALRDPASVALSRCHNANIQFKAWVNQCFFDYPLPDWAYCMMQTEPGAEARQALLAWGRGQSPRSIFGLSEQENGIFHEIHFAMPSVKFALAYSAAMARHCTRQLALAFAEALHGRDNAIYPYYLQRVRSLAEWFAVQKIDDLSQVGNLMDYFYRENYFLHDFDLKGRTLKSMLREMTLWHRELNLQEQGTGAWKTHNLSHVLEKDEVIFEELDNAKKLQYEGRRQHNCAASYLKKCMESRCAIVAMNELNSGLRVTFEINISDKKIVQAKGKCNAKPTSQELKYIRRYARDKQLAIACAA